MELLTELFPHQQAAYEKLKRLKVGALFMEQGTGKTRTTLALIQQKISAGKIGRVLWCCPCGVRENLREDIIYHCGEFPEFIQIYGIESIGSSQRIFLQALGYAINKKTMLVVDESNLIKNHFAQRTHRLQQIAEHCPYRYILNGTPISKNEADLFAQWYLLDWRILGYKSYYSFAANHLEYYEVELPSGVTVTTDRVVNVLNKDYLTRKIAPYTYQVKKSECMTLPEKKYETFYFSMTDEQWDAYEDAKDVFLEQIDETDSTTVYKLFSALQHTSSGRRITTAAKEKMKTEPIFNDIQDNPRIQTLERCLDKIGNEKAIIFAKFREEIDEIEELLRRRHQDYVEFTGRINQKTRQENRKAFQTSKQFMIANKRCGAYGLNLQFCHNVIFYDNDFDWATRAQSEDRVHRIGQDHEVNIYDIAARNGIDSMIIDNLEGKTSMVNALKRKIHEWKDLKDKELQKALENTEGIQQEEENEKNIHK